MRALRALLGILAVLVLLALLPLGVVVALNTAAGRAFAVQEVNYFAGPQLRIAGLAGHFPADIKLASLRMSEGQGAWLTGTALELRWRPLALLHGRVEVTSLTAAALDIPRLPASGKGSKGGKNTAAVPPNVALDIDRLAVPALDIGAAVAGENILLNVTGAAHLRSLAQGSLALSATAQQGRARYALNAAFNPKTVSLTLHAAEPPDGPLGHFAGPKLYAPLVLDLALTGPRDAAALKFAAALGAAKLDGAGTLRLQPGRLGGDVDLSVPALAPFAAMADENIAGSTKMHLTVAQQKTGATLALQGDVAFASAPYRLTKIVGKVGQFALRAELRGNAVNIQQLDLSGAAFDILASGSVVPSGIDLHTQVTLPQVTAFSPQIAGGVTEVGTIIGRPQDFALHARLTGDIMQRQIPSGPFSITLDARNLPNAPTGTLTGSGMLENAPLRLDAAFSRNAQGAATLSIRHALWRSMKVLAELALAPGASLPTGTAQFTVGRLEDFAPFSPVPLKGSATGDFAYAGGEKFKLDLRAQNLVTDPRLGPVDATLSAEGPITALALRLQARLARIFTAPAQIALTGVLNVPARRAQLATLAASWRQLDLRLLAPAEIATQPGIAVRHLALALNGGQINLDGTLTPNLNATLNVQHLPASLAGTFVPSLAATGTLSATAMLTGSRNAPGGQLTLTAQNIKFRSAPASALPPADFSGTANLRGQTAQITAKLSAGADISLSTAGEVPLAATGPVNLHVTGQTDLRLLDPVLAQQGSELRGQVAAAFTVTGSPAAPSAAGSIRLSGGSLENIGYGINLTQISAQVQAAGRRIDLQSFRATAGQGSITGRGFVDLSTADLPLNVHIEAHDATPVSSDVVTETLGGTLDLTGALRRKTTLTGRIHIDSSNINIPKSLPPSVANLPIINAGEKPPPPPEPPPPVALDLTVTAANKIFVRGDGLFAVLGGSVHIGGTAADPVPEGGFDLIRGDFSLAGTNLQFTQGNVSFNGAGFMPALDLEATTVTTDNNTATLIVGGTAAKPTITLTSSPPLPSDEILAQLLFGQSVSSLTPFQAASIAAALAQLSGVGGGVNPLNAVRNVLGLDELSLTGSGSGPPSVQAGRYVAPGIYVGATQATTGQGTQANVQINLYKGLKLQTTTGTSGAGTGTSSSVGLTYQFNY
jgi:translocation and assembly module TamB